MEFTVNQDISDIQYQHEQKVRSQEDSDTQRIIEDAMQQDHLPSEDEQNRPIQF